MQARLPKCDQGHGKGSNGKGSTINSVAPMGTLASTQVVLNLYGGTFIMFEVNFYLGTWRYAPSVAAVMRTRRLTNPPVPPPMRMHSKRQHRSRFEEKRCGFPGWSTKA